MVWYKVPFVLNLVISYLALSSYAKDCDNKQKILDAHNKERVGLNLEPLTWCDKLATYAKKYAKQRKGDCELVHSDCTQYGENLAKCNSDLSIPDAVKAWIDEKADYNYESNTCASGKACGHYTQVVWSSTTRVGCAKVKCDCGGTFITCNYDPPGNCVGEKPY